MWKLILFGVTALGTYGLITDFTSFRTIEICIILVLIVLHVYKYIWPIIRHFNTRSKRNRFLQFYQSLSKAEKDTADRLWDWDKELIQNMLSGKKNVQGDQFYEDRLWEIYNVITIDYDTLRKNLKKEVKKENANSAIRAKAAKDLKEKNARNAELARQNKKYAENKRKQSLTKEYGAENAKKIMQNKVWQGMNKAMLNESRGRPVKKQEQIHKTTVKNHFFYNSRRTRQGNEKPTFRVDLENNLVVGWKDLE